MLGFRSILLALGATCLSLSAFASTALAAEPATVTVRVEGFNGVTLLPQTQVTTSTAPVPVEGGTCSGTSAGGALYDATQGDWKAKLESEGVAILGIEGVDLPPFGPGNYAYWAVWVNNEFAKTGACGEEVGPGADLVFAGQCFALGPECPTSATAPDHFLTMALKSPTSGDVGDGEPVTLVVGSLSTASGAPETPPAGITVAGMQVTPNPQGVATVQFAAPGTYTLQARAPDSVPSDPYTICVHNGNDGTCGTFGPSGTPAAGGGVLSYKNAPYKGPFAVVASVIGLHEGGVYKRGAAPRLLQGSVSLHSAIRDVELRLTRRQRERGGRHNCSYYDGITDRFRSMRCGAAHGRYFSIGAKASFSYLLPSALASGRYVLDIRAHDEAGNRSTLIRGKSRIVFYVR